ncbi:ubiquitin hydrolase, putative [Leishmania donovani]|uniref:ubiquitinyl hydrolase 1 n=1 Tax=Leishmania donovani TaxID=5661 RepID=E9BNN4_LEIDO|nr:ubiquitin hydrolase, putative [Leishmania donovani]CBZ36862.1 ubiquitin hydrolase, putative [Leishmania donovani]
MGGPPGSQVAQKKPNRPRHKKQEGVSENGASAKGATTLASSNGCGVTAMQAAASPSPFQPPRQPNVYTDCAPLRELYDQVRLSECGLHGSSVRGGAGRPRRREEKGRPFTLQQSFSELPYPRGIMNNSNFCFMNSMLQALMFIPSFAQLTVSVSCDAQARQLCPTLATLGKWTLQYWKPGFTRLAMIAPTLMPRLPAGANNSNSGAPRSAVVPASQRILDGSVQEDAQEFLQKLLERVHEELVGLEEAFQQADASEAATESEMGLIAPAATTTTASGGGGGGGGRADAPDDATASTFHKKGWTFVKGKEKLAVREHEDVQGQSKLLASIFGGTLESHLQGKQRQRDRVSVLIERYYCLPVDVGFAPECTVEQALERTFMTERIYDSEHEKKLKKTLRLGRLPSVLFLQLRRWAVTREGELVKLDNVVRIKRTLLIPRTICADETLGNTERAYRLLSVVCHRGDAVSRGHYVTYLVHHAATPAVLKVQSSEPGNKDTAILRLPPDAATVILCNDANISVCPAKNMEKETMYFLVYQKTS